MDYQLDIHKIEGIVEAVLFACGEPIDAERLCAVLGMEQEEFSSVMDYIAACYNEKHDGTQLIALDGCYQLATNPEYAEYVRHALDSRRRMPLSQAAMEVLAVVAYNQPVTRSYIDQVRGVDSSAVLAGLVDKELVEEKGKLDAPGRPTLFGTTLDFLRVFGISSLKDLPEPPQSEKMQTEANEQLKIEN